MKNITLSLSDQEYLTRVSELFQAELSSFEQLQNAVTVLHKVCSRITGIAGAIRDKAEKYETRLSTGYALSPGYAADCTLDTWRTVKYIRALKKAVEKLRLENPDRPVHVLYAGSGPFAPFAIPLTRYFSAREVCFTVLDVHERSLEALKKIIETFDLADYFRELICCDATGYQLEGPAPQILVTETMHRTLSREPHVMICRNLIPQLAPGGLVIPEKVAIRACMSVMKEEERSMRGDLPLEEIAAQRLDLGVVFEISRDTDFTLTPDGRCLKGRTITLGEEVAAKNILALLTEITLFEDLVLKERESGITFPHYAFDLERLNPGESIEFLFCAQELPGIQYKVFSEMKL